MENHLFTFYATPDSKFPQQIQARFCFYDEFVEIPHTEAKMEVEHGCWIIYSEDSNISLLTMKDFVENFAHLFLFERLDAGRPGRDGTDKLVISVNGDSALLEASSNLL
jgi:hypothetical protein